MHGFECGPHPSVYFAFLYQPAAITHIVVDFVNAFHKKNNKFARFLENNFKIGRKMGILLTFER